MAAMLMAPRQPTARARTRPTGGLGDTQERPMAAMLMNRPPLPTPA